LRSAPLTAMKPGMEVRVSVRRSFLVLLDAAPMDSYGLKAEFEAATREPVVIRAPLRRATWIQPRDALRYQ
jgi:hypothetical protein